MNDPIDYEIQCHVGAHARKQFGDRAVERIALKLGEETGEVLGALTRHLELRDGRTWDDEIKEEIGDVMVVLMVLCDKMGFSLQDIASKGIESFAAREWNIGNKS